MICFHKYIKLLALVHHALPMDFKKIATNNQNFRLPEEKRNEFKEYALNTIRKDKRVNIRINEHDLEGIKRKAIEEGLPYQTLISSILHKYLNGKLVDANTIKIMR